MTEAAANTITVLVVDDEEHIRELLRAFLEQRGFRVLLARNAEETLARSDLDRVQVALLDLRLGGAKDGHALQRELNRLYPDMAKILISGQADLDDAIVAFADEAFSFICKPFSSLKEIAVLIERAAQSKRLERENREYAASLRDANLALSAKVTEQTAETEQYQRILSHLFQVSSRIGRIEPAGSLLDFVCQAVVEAGAFRRAVVLLADEQFLIRHIGAWQQGGVPDTLHDALRGLIGQPLRPFEFGRTEERVGPAVFARTAPVRETGEPGPAGWQQGDRLFMPVVRRDGAIFGYLSLEQPVNGVRPSTDVIRLLDVLLGHAALHLEAQELRDELRRRAEELELRVHERTRDLRLSEERFSRLVNTTTDIVYITDESDKLTFLNEAFTRTLGYVRENYIGRTLRRVLEDLFTDNPINHRAIQELSSHTSDHTTHHVEVLSRQGDKRTLEINRTIVRQGGVLKGSQGIIRDITEHRVLLQQLVASERSAATGRLAAGLAHEINNPLQAMASQLNALQKKIADGENPSQNIELFRESIERLRHIVRNMLDLHRGPSMSQSPVNLNETVEKVIELTAQQLSEAKIQVRFDPAPDLPSILGLPQELLQVILNLVLNALESMPDGGQLSISTRALANTVEVSVRDTGVGIPEEHRPHVFEPFFTFKPSGSGTGLGLYLSKNIVDLHQGKISVESEKGKGACFTVSLPRR